MATCPECGQTTSILQKDIFTGLCPQCRRGVTPASLGCGTLIIIGIVVAIFSRAGNQNLELEVSSLRATVEELNEAVNSQTNEIERLRSAVEKLEPAGDGDE